jgi:arylsulfatase
MKRREFLKAGIIAGLSGTFGCAANQQPSNQSLNKQTSPSRREKTKRPNILWIMMDDGRADAVGCYGKSWVRTPHMDALAGDGVCFQKAIVQNPVCVPSRTSMKTGHYAHNCGIMAMGKPPAQPETYLNQEKIKAVNNAPSLLEAWTAVGMQPLNVGKTHAFRKVWKTQEDRPAHVDFFGRPRSDYAKQKYAESPPSDPHPIVNIKTHRWMIGGIVPIEPHETQTWRIGDRAVEVLKQLASQDDPFFLRVSFHAPHVPCRVPKEYFIDPAKIDLPLPSEEELKSKPRFEREQLRVYAGGLDLTKEQIGTCRGTYYGMVSLVDAQVGRLVEVLQKAGVLDNTIIAINSDQGFQLGEHGLWKKRVLYEQNVCAPFILHGPDHLPAGKNIEEPVEMIDFLPTLMELSDLFVPDSIAGRSLLPLIEGKVKTWREATFCDIDHSQSMYKELRENSGRRVMVRTKEWKLIYFMDERAPDKDGSLYHLKRDPDEQVNLYNEPNYKSAINRLETLAQTWAAT